MAERENQRRPARPSIGKSAAQNRAKASARKTSPKRWSQRVTRESDALDLRHGVFTLPDPKRIAASLKRSAERSSRRKAGAYRSALSMLTFYINRAGKTFAEDATRAAGAGQGRTEAGVSSRVNSRRGPLSSSRRTFITTIITIIIARRLSPT